MPGSLNHETQAVTKSSKEIPLFVGHHGLPLHGFPLHGFPLHGFPLHGICRIMNGRILAGGVHAPGSERYAERERWKMKKFLWTAVFAMAFAALAPTEGFASCTGSNRVAQSDAECMTAQWTGVLETINKSRISFRNNCPSLGTIGAAVGFNGRSDVFRSSVSGWTTMLGHSGATVENVYCCKDREGKFCSRGDLANDTWCSSQFGDSPAASTCTATATTGDPTAETCAITADCTHGDDTVNSSVTVDMELTETINACDGVLTEGRCPAS